MSWQATATTTPGTSLEDITAQIQAMTPVGQDSPAALAALKAGQDAAIGVLCSGVLASDPATVGFSIRLSGHSNTDSSYPTGNSLSIHINVSGMA